jgi:hypothetical protein
MKPKWMWLIWWAFFVIWTVNGSHGIDIPFLLGAFIVWRLYENGWRIQEPKS